MPYAEDVLRRCDDQARWKQSFTVYVEDVLEDACRQYGVAPRFLMVIRGMSCTADLYIILCAARHLGLTSHYSVNVGYNERLSDEYERGYIEVSYTAGIRVVELDDETMVEEPIALSETERRNIWTGLFEAAGYRVSFGNATSVPKILTDVSLAARDSFKESNDGDMAERKEGDTL